MPTKNGGGVGKLDFSLPDASLIVYKKSHVARVALQTITGKLVNLGKEPDPGRVCCQVCAS